jgi:hypothetical protein
MEATMDRTRWLRRLTLCLSLLAGAAALADEMEGHAKAPGQPPSPAFEALKALAGEWQGPARALGSAKTFPSKATIKVVSGGSAVMLVTDPGGAYEMVTMFHRDDDALLATHYCAAMNQPRLKAAQGASAKQVTFDFVDGTNLKAYPGRMQSLVMAMTDATHHTQTWVSREGAKEETMVFELARVK